MLKILNTVKPTTTKLLTLEIKNKSIWSFVKPSPPDPILGLSVAFNADSFEKKVNLGVGAYRDSNGKPFVLQSVRNAQMKQLNKDLEYAPIDGLPCFIRATQKLAFGDNDELIKRTATVQTLSGTGSLRLAAEFLSHSKDLMGSPIIYIPEPTWPNHKNILTHSGLKWNTYDYYDIKTNGINWSSMYDSIKKAPVKSVILFHACAHNPTGTDPSMKQWDELSTLCKEKNHVIWFDSAYQGFASGDPVKDSMAYNIFINHGHNIMLSQSYAKNMGLYGMRVGALSVVTENQEEKSNVLGKLKSIIRPIYSNPPVEGARIVSEIINNVELKDLWYKEIKIMANRINGMRVELKQKLENLGSNHDWSHITNQIGMFCYTGLSKEQVDRLINEFHIYLTSDGRISMAGVTPQNIDYIAKSIYKVTQN
jgi:aspartate aminotransferase